MQIETSAGGLARQTSVFNTETPAAAHAILDMISEAAFILDSNGVIIGANRAFSLLFRASLKDSIGANINSFVKFCCAETLLFCGTVCEMTGLRTDGSEFPLEITAQLVNDNGKQTISAIIRDIPERKKEVKTLEESGALYRNIMEQAADAIILAGPDGKFIDANHAAETLLGRSRDEIIKLTFRDIRPPEDIERYAEAFARVWKTGSVKMGGEVIRADGTRVPVALNAAIVELPGRRMALGIFRDMTEYRKAEREKEERERLLADSQRIAHLGSWDWDVKTNKVQWSDEMFHLLGLNPATDEASYDNFLATIHPDDYDKVRNEISRALTQGDRYITDRRVLRPDGTIRYAHTEGRVERDEKGEPVRIVAIAHDITERHAAEEKLKLFRHMLDNATDAIFLTDPVTARFVDVNEGAARSLGYEREELIGRSVADIVVFQTPLLPWETHVETVRKSGGITVEGLHRKKDSSLFPVEVTLRLAFHGGAEYMLAVARDITERLRRQELENVSHTLEAANLELSEFTTVASHDLKAPLHTIMGFSERLLSKCSTLLDEQGLDYVKRIRKAAANMNMLIQDLLIYSWTSGAQKKAEPFPLSSVVESAIDNLRALVDEKQAFFDIRPLPVIRGDRTMLRQAFQNIFSNSIKYARPGIPPLIIVRQKDGGGGNEVTIVIEDNGIGFEQWQAERIFMMFERLHPQSRYEGAGIGLATVKKIVERHGGVVTAAGKPGEGASFEIRLPVAMEEQDGDRS